MAREAAIADSDSALSSIGAPARATATSSASEMGPKPTDTVGIPPFSPSGLPGRFEGVKAVLFAEPGGPDVLALGEVADPEPAAGKVLLDVAATAVNRADLLRSEERRVGKECRSRWSRY